MKKVLIVFITFASFLVFSTNAYSEGKGIREKVADSYYKNLAYEKAIPYYVELAESKMANGEILRKTADCFNKIGDTSNAVKWYRKLYEKRWANLDDKYEFLLVLRKAAQYDESLKILKEYLGDGGKKEFAKFLYKNPNYLSELKKKNKDKYIVKTVPFNSEEHDFAPSFYENGIVYATPAKGKRKSTRRKFAWDMTSFLQLYYVQNQGGESYSEPVPFNLSRYTKYHDGPVAFNKNFTEAYLTRSNYTGKGKLQKGSKGTVQVNLFVSKRTDGNSWSELEPFPYNSTSYSVGCATLSKEGNVIVFASDMSGGKGETDLWMCTRDGSGQWSSPAHLGDKINTERRDNYPFLDDDGNLYFASDGGLYGLGGYDIFWVPGFLKGKDKVYNLGAPINSNADDFGYIFDTKTSKGYFNSGREGVKGDKNRDDIFTFEKLISFVDIQILDKETKSPIKNATGCIATEMGESIKDNIETDETGSFSEELAATTYVFCGEAEGYDRSEIKMSLKKGEYATGQILLSKVAAPEKVVEEKNACPEITLEDIFYDFDKYEIRNDASATLDDLLVFLKANPNMRIKLKAHTDSRGKASYNDWLSQKRADSALNYLAARGIDRSRMTAIGYGEAFLVNGCSDGVKCSERQHQANRRTVVEIITDDCIEVEHISNPYAY